VTLLRVNELLASREARLSVEARYLDGHAALFPDIAAAFDKQLRTSQEIAVAAWRAAELDGVDAAPPEEPDAVTLRAGELVADLVEPAKSTALEKLGEGQPAFDIANAWLRAKLATGRVPQPDLVTQVAAWSCQAPTSKVLTAVCCVPAAQVLAAACSRPAAG
jgi:hypothetical protein